MLSLMIRLCIFSYFPVYIFLLRLCFKLLPVIFEQIFIYNQMITLHKLWKKIIFFHLKSFFQSWDTSIFVFPSSPNFLSVSHRFRAWSNINLKVYDIIICLNKNLITHLVWYLQREKRYDIKTLSIDKISIR